MDFNKIYDDWYNDWLNKQKQPSTTFHSASGIPQPSSHKIEFGKREFWRKLFAGMAIAGLSTKHISDFQETARNAVTLADALLEELENKSDNTQQKQSKQKI